MPDGEILNMYVKCFKGTNLAEIRKAANKKNGLIYFKFGK